MGGGGHGCWAESEGPGGTAAKHPEGSVRVSVCLLLTTLGVHESEPGRAVVVV